MVVHRTGQHGDVAVDLGGRAQHLQQLDSGAHIFQARHVGEVYLFITEQGREQDRQRGVFGAGDGHFAVESTTTIDFEFVHFYFVTKSGGQ